MDTQQFLEATSPIATPSEAFLIKQEFRLHLIRLLVWRYPNRMCNGQRKRPGDHFGQMTLWIDRVSGSIIKANV